MMKRIGITGVALVATVFAFSALAVSSASANLPLACYSVSNFEFKVQGGDWEKGETGTCENAVAALTGRWVTATPEFRIPNTPSLWCAKLSPTTLKTGAFTEKECKTKGTNNNGEYIEVLTLPDISITLPGSSYPLHLNYESLTVKTKLEDGNGALLEGKGLKLLLLTGELASLGTFRADFFNVEETSSAKKCHTSGDKTATVLTEGSFHLVYTNLKPLYLGLLFLPNEVKVECEGVTTKVRGDVISGVNFSGNSEETELLNIKGKLEKGSTAGSQEITEYYNEGGTKVKAGLIAETGSVEHASNEQVKEETELTALSPNMFVITSR
jgi:hypothetical protein